jgi:hypothetical protein
MKLLTYLFALLLVALCGCEPKNQEVTDEQIETGSRTEVLDSIANTREDGVKTDGNEPIQTIELPPPVAASLNAMYPGWKQPALATDAKKQAENYPTGPTIVNGNFNSDTLQDYALQLQQGEEVIIVAILQDTARGWKTHELHRDKLFNEQGKPLSLYHVYLLEKGEEVQDLKTKKNLKTTNNAIVVSKGNSTQAYVHENGKFKPYQAVR